MHLRVRSLLYLSLIMVIAGCKEHPPAERSQAPISSTQHAAAAMQDVKNVEPSIARPEGPIRFTDVTAQAGIHFRHNSGAFGKKYLPETMGSGVCVLDYDNDGWQDILFVNSMDWPGHKSGKSFPALYHNNKDGTFTDVTRQAGLAVEMYGMGCAVADYDNDGYEDIYITALNGNHLFHNLGQWKVLRCYGEGRSAQSRLCNQRRLVRL